jgi:Zn-finger nucleic acid-binding protein
MWSFTVREMLLATLVVGLVLGWWLDRGRLERLRAMEEYRATNAESLAARWRDEAYKSDHRHYLLQQSQRRTGE